MNGTARPWFCLIPAAVLLVGCDLSEVSKQLSESPPPQTEEGVVEPDQLSLPNDAGRGRWYVGVAPQLPATRPVPLGHLLPKRHRIWGGAISQRSATALLTYMDKTERGRHDTFAVVCDLRQGKAIARWRVPEFLAPYSIHPDGRAAILSRQDGVLSARETLYLATKTAHSNDFTMEMWTPLVDPSTHPIKPYQTEAEIIWASFVGASHIVTLNNAGKVHLWDFPGLSRVAVFPGVKGVPTVTPDGSKAALLTEDMIALLDPSIPGITHVHRVGDLPEDPLLSFHPDGRVLAIAGKGQSIVLDLGSLRQSHAMIDRLSTSQSMNLMPDLGWAGSFLYKGRQLYTFDSPIPVWRITGTQWEMPVGRHLWTVVRGKSNFRTGDREIVFRSFELPVASIARELHSILQTTDVIALRIGDPVRIDVSGLPPQRRHEVRRTLTARLQAEGYRPSPSAAVTLRASLDEPRSSDVTYHRMWDMSEKRTYSYEIQRTRLEFLKNNDRLWTATAYEAPPSTLAVHKLPKTEHVATWGGPDYSLFSEHRLPGYLRGDRSGSALGKTHLSADGMK